MKKTSMRLDFELRNCGGVMVYVELTTSEILMGATAGLMRQVENIKLGRKANHGLTDKNVWGLHVEGALGEMAVAKALNFYWSGKGAFRGFDVFDVEVRTTHHENGSLILHPEDDSSKRFFLVTGIYGKYKVRGSILAADGKVQKYWKDPVGGRAAFFVPQSALSDIRRSQRLSHG